MEHREGDNIFAGDDAPRLWIERFPERPEHSERRQSDHWQTNPGKERYLLPHCHGTENDKENQDAKCDSVSIKREEIWRAEQKNGHGRHIKLPKKLDTRVAVPK